MIRVVVIDDHPALRAGLHAVLDAEPGIVFAGESDGDEESVWPLLNRTTPDLALLDYHLPARRRHAALLPHQAACPGAEGDRLQRLRRPGALPAGDAGQGRRPARQGRPGARPVRGDPARQQGRAAAGPGLPHRHAGRRGAPRCRGSAVAGDAARRHARSARSRPSCGASRATSSTPSSASSRGCASTSPRGVRERFRHRSVAIASCFVRVRGARLGGDEQNTTLSTEFVHHPGTA